MLQDEGRRSFAELAGELGESESTVRFRFRRLSDGKAIRGVVSLVNPRAVGLNEPAALFIKANTTKADDVLRDLDSIGEAQHIYQFTGD